MDFYGVILKHITKRKRIPLILYKSFVPNYKPYFSIYVQYYFLGVECTKSVVLVCMAYVCKLKKMNQFYCSHIWFTALSHFIIMHFMTGCAFSKPVGSILQEPATQTLVLI
ncbi:hypothetical protein Hamer_G001179 [Homarus americanus]|uniref:Uncharacterized protein n=1 Tax=Homarus americanus TaxID=6706 RepID=A0A8J5TI66_HOMAM|nr:hypothetical protein Hamer_G001179 [Homarus americanus]